MAQVKPAPIPPNLKDALKFMERFREALKAEFLGKPAVDLSFKFNEEPPFGWVLETTTMTHSPWKLQYTPSARKSSWTDPTTNTVRTSTYYETYFEIDVNIDWRAPRYITRIAVGRSRNIIAWLHDERKAKAKLVDYTDKTPKTYVYTANIIVERSVEVKAHTKDLAEKEALRQFSTMVPGTIRGGVTHVNGLLKKNAVINKLLE